MKLVEVIDGLRGAPEVGDAMMALARRMGHVPVRAKDTPGFIVNHAGRGFGTEALRLLGENVAAPHVIDAVLREQAGFRLGPFELLDLTGLDVSVPVMEAIYHQYFEEPRFRPSPLAAQRRVGRPARAQDRRGLLPLRRRPRRAGGGAGGAGGAAGERVDQSGAAGARRARARTAGRPRRCDRGGRTPERRGAVHRHAARRGREPLLRARTAGRDAHRSAWTCCSATSAIAA